MDINLVFDASVADAPAGFTTALAAAVQYLDALILDPITVNIQIGYGEIDGVALPAGTIGEGGCNGQDATYAEVAAALRANADTPAEGAADAELPAADPSGGAGFVVANALLQAWGLMPTDGTETDGFAGFSSTAAFDYDPNPGDAVPAGEVPFVASAELELTHALGRVSSLNPGAAPGLPMDPLNLFQYSAPGQLQTVPGGAAYFSLDGGQSNLGNFDTTADAADWAQGHAPDAFNQFLAAGAPNPVSATDLAELGVIGFDVACFASGTRIRTPRGEVPVEALRPGEDCVVSAGGAIAPVVWVGWRRLAPARHPRPQDVMPVRVRAGAFAAGRPARDLRLSPDHAVFVDGVLIPIRYLVNGRTIAQEPVAAITYWHVELERHDVLLAEGLPAESYLDTGNRAAFANGGAALRLHPDFARRAWSDRSCAPLVLEGPPVARARRRLLRRAARLGHRLTEQPGLRVLADGRPVASGLGRGRWLVALPNNTQGVRLRSRAWVPAQTRPGERDHRRLGVAIAALWLDGREMARESPALAAGWHEPEPDLRWTGGDAELLVGGARHLAFEVAMVGTYWAAAA